MVEAQKMAKSLGNFIMLNESCAGDRTIVLEVEDTSGKKKKGPPKMIKKTVHIGWSSDSTRLALADAGDGLDDANFASETADNAILRLTTEETFIRDVVENSKSGSTYRAGEFNFHDRAFRAKLRRAAALADEAYAAMRYRDVLKSGFFELQGARDVYREAMKKTNNEMHIDLLTMYIETLLVCMSPVCPHFCDYHWRRTLGREGHVMDAPWPTFAYAGSDSDDMLLREEQYVSDLATGIRQLMLRGSKKKKKGGKKKAPEPEPETPKVPKARVYIGLSYPQWKQKLLTILGDWFNKDGSIDQKTAMKRLKATLAEDDELKKLTKSCMQTASFVIGESKTMGARAFELSSPFDQAKLLADNIDFVKASAGVEEVDIVIVDEDIAESNRKASQAVPGRPSYEMQ